MNTFIKWGCWGALILSWPIGIITSTTIGIGWGILSFYLILCVSHTLEERCNSLCEGVEDIDTLNTKLANGADLNALGPSNRRPLIETIIKSNDINLIKTMIEKGADVNIVGNGKTPLDVAIQYGKDDIADLLVSLGANTEKHRFKYPPLSCKYYKLLLEGGTLFTDTKIKEIMNLFTFKYENCQGLSNRFEMLNFAKIFKLFVKYNVDLNNFWKYLPPFLSDKALEYPDIKKHFDEKLTSEQNIELINTFLNKILEETKDIDKEDDNN